jgi:hypothetical protein
MTSSTITPKQQENLKPGIRGKRNTREENVKIMTDIISLAPKHDDFEIMRILGLPNSTYYRYKKRIYKQSKKLWEQVCKESLEYRALLVRKSLDQSIKIYEEIASDPTQKAEDRMEAAIHMVDAQVEFLKLIKEGPQFIRDFVVEGRN